MRVEVREQLSGMSFTSFHCVVRVFRLDNKHLWAISAHSETRGPQRPALQVHSVSGQLPAWNLPHFLCYPDLNRGLVYIVLDSMVTYTIQSQDTGRSETFNLINWLRTPEQSDEVRWVCGDRDLVIRVISQLRTESDPVEQGLDNCISKCPIWNMKSCYGCLIKSW